jgi:hypothetical protein
MDAANSSQMPNQRDIALLKISLLGHGHDVRRRILVLFGMMAVSQSVQARVALGTFERWGAFRDDAPLRCFAIAEPIRGGDDNRPYAAIGTWPERNVRGQLHIRLGQEKAADSPVILLIGAKRFILAAGGINAWAPDARTDAAITAAMRSAPNMTVASRQVNGRVITQTYALKGVATAMDAASVGCARR